MLRKILVSSFFLLILFFLFNVNETKAFNPHQPEKQVQDALKNGLERAEKSGKIIKASRDAKPTSSRKLIYDIYRSGQGKQGAKFELLDLGNGEQWYLTMQGWAALIGYHNHTSTNHSTHILVKNTSTGEEFLYRTQPLDLHAHKDVEYNKQTTNENSIYNPCPNGTFNKASESCNMWYWNVGMKIYLPIHELFPKREPQEYKMYLIKRVLNHIVYDELRLPYSFDIPMVRSDTNEEVARLSISSGINDKLLIMIGENVIKRYAPREVHRDRGRFIYRYPYTMVDHDQAGTAIWYGVQDNGISWTSSPYWLFGGEIATIKYQPIIANVTINHVDKKTNTLIKSERKQVLINQNHTFSPESRGIFKDKNGNPYVPVPLNQTVTTKITGDRTINFYYKAVIPNPTEIVEEKNTTEGKAKGDFLWFLQKDKDDSPSKFVIRNDADIDGKHYATRNLKYRVDINFPNSTKGFIEQKGKINSFFPNPNSFKGGSLKFLFEYEYTNHYRRNYECVDQQGSDCFEWKWVNDTPVWDKEYVKKSTWEVELPVDHQYGETIKIYNIFEENIAKLKIGRKATLNGNENQKIEKTVMYETFKNNTLLENLITQTFITVDQNIKYESDLKNKLYFIEEEMNFYPHKEFLDNNLRDKYKVENSEPNFPFGDYELPMRVDNKTDSNIQFKLADVFYITKATGFQFSLPYEESRSTVINQIAKEEYEAYTKEAYDDTVLNSHNNLSILFINIDGNSTLKPETFYQSKYKFGKLGLSDIELESYVFHSFNQYLLGSVFDDAVIAEQRESVKEDVAYTHSIRLTPKEIKQIKKLSKDRGMLLHSFRSTDIHRKYDELKNILPSFDN